MVFRDLKHQIKAVEARRERTKRVNDVENGVYLSAFDTGDIVVDLRGEYSKRKALKTEYVKRMWQASWTFVFIVILYVIIINVFGI